MYWKISQPALTFTKRRIKGLWLIMQIPAVFITAPFLVNTISNWQSTAIMEERGTWYEILHGVPPLSVDQECHSHRGTCMSSFIYALKLLNTIWLWNQDRRTVVADVHCKQSAFFFFNKKATTNLYRIAFLFKLQFDTSDLHGCCSLFSSERHNCILSQ